MATFENGLDYPTMQERQNPDGSWSYTPSSNAGQGAQEFTWTDAQHSAQQQKVASEGDLMSWLGPALIAAAVGGLAFSGAGVAGGAEAAAGGASTLPESYWSMQALNGAGGTATDAAATGAGTVGGTGSTLPSWATNYINSIGTPEWMAQQAGSTALSQFANSGGNAAANAGINGFPTSASEIAAANASVAAGDPGAGNFYNATSGGNGLNLGQFGNNAIGSLISGGISALGANAAGRQQAAGANTAAATNMAMFNTINQQQAPWRQAGMSALGDIARLQPQFQHQFDANDLKTNLAPNYQFQLDQGLGAVKNASNLQTGMLSGNTLRGINDYAQNFAGNAYQQAFNNYNTNQTNIFNRLSNIAGLGQVANASTANAGTTGAGNAGNAQTAAGAAQAAGTVGTTNAVTSGANNALGWYTLPQLMNLGNA